MFLKINRVPLNVRSCLLDDIRNAQRLFNKEMDIITTFTLIKCESIKRK